MAKTGHPNFVYEIQSPWRLGLHKWGLVANHSGPSFSTLADIRNFMEGVTSPFALCFGTFINPDASHGTTGTTNLVVRWAYYDGINSAPLLEQTYSLASLPPTPLLPTGTSWTSQGSATHNEPLETCVLLEAPCGLNVRNKPVKLKKFIHAVPTGNTQPIDSGTAIGWTLSGTAPTAALTLGNGSLYGSRVLIAPSGKQPATNGWTVNPVPSNHQMPRGRKRKKVAVSSSLLLTLAEDALKAGVVVAAAG
jgi:hypothetical protein